MIEQTHADDTELVHRIAQDAICACYPLYYPQPVVRWFSEWHSPEKIAADIAADKVFLLRHHGTAVATATLKGAEVKRLFVLPEHQRAGYGSLGAARPLSFWEGAGRRLLTSSSLLRTTRLPDYRARSDKHRGNSRRTRCGARL